jgi:hypothetical protein
MSIASFKQLRFALFAVGGCVDTTIGARVGSTPCACGSSFSGLVRVAIGSASGSLMFAAKVGSGSLDGFGACCRRSACLSAAFSIFAA